LQRDDTTFHMDEMGLRERWQYYISSFIRVEPTEGVPRSRLQKSVLARNLPSSDADSDDGNIPKPLQFDENLVLRICLNSNKIVWQKGTSEYFIYNTVPELPKDRAAADERSSALHEHRDQVFKEKFVMNSSWMRNVKQDEVQKANEKFQKWMKDGVAPLREEEMEDAE
jgi:paired amphipathic helix protein Sin3a